MQLLVLGITRLRPTPGVTFVSAAAGNAAVDGATATGCC